jgi:uncharacterized protein
MKCPNCNEELETSVFDGIDVEKCAKCGGMWFDAQELDQHEDSSFDQDEFKNTMVTNLRDDTRKCPKCSMTMKRFNYRWEDLELETCEHAHGFWLDKGEEERVTEIMKQRIKDLDRKDTVEREWAQQIGEIQSPSFLSKLKNLFK